ncbi:protein asteroid homolog 1-like [Nematostella vectensis]|uniref:protein asteroid homolog 1-like n=1 Tax=Nematostella vectensis TaxID=45351 RepID=UPI00207715D4|nr:protein asteroid homolog 1-like [Nematostella vectensis]
MGIRGLSSYIETLDVWEKIELKDTKVVIDGSCLVFNLYYNSGLDFRNGGEYYEFAQVVTSFFQALSSNNVEAYVVLDGAIDPSGRKVDTIESRMQDSIDNAGKPDGRVRPKMSALVLSQAMRDIGVKFVRIDCEADEEIASLAKKFQCPVLSDDSDFFIFDLPGGFIRLTSLHWRSFPLSTKLYSRQKMADYLQLRPDLMPLFASVLENDFVSSSAVEPFYTAIPRNHKGGGSRFRNVADFLRGLESIEKGVDSVLKCIKNQECQNHLRDALHTSLNSYTSVGKSKASNFFISDGGANDGWSEIGGTEFPSWVVNGFRKCAYPSDYISAAISGMRFLACQVENLAKSSSCSCTLDLRRALYAMTQPGKPNEEKHDKVTRIKEWDRKKKRLTNYFRDPKYVLEGYGKLPTLIQIKELPLEEREMLFFLLLESNTSTIKLQKGKR